MPGQPVFHGYATSSSPAGLGGSARVEAASITGTPNDMSFFVWVALIGIVLPLVLLGGLNVGGFSFVFKKG